MKDILKNFFTDGIGRVVDFFFLNLCFCITCIPVLTIGTSCSAMYYVIFHIFEEKDAHLTKQYFKAWKDNFINSSTIWLISLFLYFFCFMAFTILGRTGSGIMTALGTGILCLIAFMNSVFLIYALSLQARFINTIGNTIKNALILSMGHLGTSFLCFLITFCPLIFTLLIPNLIYFIGGFMILFGFSIQFYGISKKIFPIYQDLEEQASTNT